MQPSPYFHTVVLQFVIFGLQVGLKSRPERSLTASVHVRECASSLLKGSRHRSTGCWFLKVVQLLLSMEDIEHITFKTKKKGTIFEEAMLSQHLNIKQGETGDRWEQRGKPPGGRIPGSSSLWVIFMEPFLLSSFVNCACSYICYTMVTHVCVETLYLNSTNVLTGITNQNETKIPNWIQTVMTKLVPQKNRAREKNVFFFHHHRT